MPKFVTQSLTLSLEQLQAAGFSPGGSFLMGPPLPMDGQIVGREIIVTEALAGPDLIAASASFAVAAPQADFDLMTPGTYQSGSQQFLLSILLQGCWMAQLTAGQLTATIYYDQFANFRFPLSPV